MFGKRLVSFVYLLLIFVTCSFVFVKIVSVLWRDYLLSQQNISELEREFLSGNIAVYDDSGLPDPFKLERIQRNNPFIDYVHVYNQKEGLSFSGGMEPRFTTLLGNDREYYRYPWQRFFQTSLPGIQNEGEKFVVDLIVNVVSSQVLQTALLYVIGGLVLVLFLTLFYRTVESRVTVDNDSNFKINRSRRGMVLSSKNKVKHKLKTDLDTLDIPEMTVFSGNHPDSLDSTNENALNMDFLNSLDNLLDTEENDGKNNELFIEHDDNDSHVDLLPYLENKDFDSETSKDDDTKGKDEIFSETLEGDKRDDEVLRNVPENSDFSISDLDKESENFSDNDAFNIADDSEDQEKKESLPVSVKFPEPLLLKPPVQSNFLNFPLDQSDQKEDKFLVDRVNLQSVVNNDDLFDSVVNELQNAEKQQEDFSFLIFTLKYPKSLREVRDFFMYRKNFFVRDILPHVYGVFMNKTSLNQAYGIAGEFSYFMEKHANITAIGISSRFGRNVQPNHLIDEATSALSEAIDLGGCIVGFRPDIERYQDLYTTSDNMNSVNFK